MAATSGGTSKFVIACLIITNVALLSVVVIPRLKLGAMGSGQITQVWNAAQQVKQLETEVAQLRQALQAAQEAVINSQQACNSTKTSVSTQAALSSILTATNHNTEPVVAIDLNHLLGTDRYYGGISFDVLHCGAPYTFLYPEMTNDTLWNHINTLTEELRQAMSRILKKDVAKDAEWPLEIAPGLRYEQQLDVMVRDPRTVEWRNSISLIMSKYLVEHNHQKALKCIPGLHGLEPEIKDLSQLGKLGCPGMSDEEVLTKFGFHAVPQAPIHVIAHDALKWGMCTKPTELRRSYGDWIKNERMMVEEWHTFHTKNLEQDAVLLLFDMIYESLAVFKKQYWLGVIAMQNPFDFLSISDIIWQTQPDIIIETGTANGGSALMWASILHLLGLHNSKVVTVDLFPPSWDPSEIHWGGKPRLNATDSPLWSKHVTFIKGSSLDDSTLAAVQNKIPPGAKVLVLLDSAHEPHHVMKEMTAYCPLVTLGSYCIVEDTKLSRWSSNSVLQTVKDWVQDGKKGGGRFAIDRDRELLYTHHAFGYLKRVS